MTGPPGHYLVLYSYKPRAIFMIYHSQRGTNYRNVSKAMQRRVEWMKIIAFMAVSEKLSLLFLCPQPQTPLLSVTDRVWDIAAIWFKVRVRSVLRQRDEVGEIYVSVVVIILGDSAGTWRNGQMTWWNWISQKGTSPLIQLGSVHSDRAVQMSPEYYKA